MFIISSERQRLLAENLFPHKVSAFLKKQLSEKCNRLDAILYGIDKKLHQDGKRTRYKT